MSTQTRLTLSSVLVMTAIVAIISMLDLGYQMDAQYQATLEHAELLKRMASNAVVDALNRRPSTPLARCPAGLESQSQPDRHHERFARVAGDRGLR